MSFVAPSLVKSYFTAARYNKIPQKFIRRKMQSSFEVIDFFRVELNSSRNIQIFKKNLAMNMGKSIFQNLMSSTLLRLCYTVYSLACTYSVFVIGKGECICSFCCTHKTSSVPSESVMTAVVVS